MSRQALYRKYRSKSLGEVIGQEHVTEVLAAAIKNGAFSHAYLFTGPRGIGKTSVARIVAYLVNGLEYGETSFDIIEIDAASHGLKEDIKDLIEKARISPTKEKYKVYIIDEVHSMKHDAFNTFLKLLEEPPEHVIFILATTDPQKLPATILSRAQRFHFRPVEQSKVVKHLKTIAKNEKIDIDDEALEMVASRGEGSMRDSISLLDQLGGFNKPITRQIVEELLGLAPVDHIKQVVAALTEKDIAKVYKLLGELRSEGISPGMIVSQLNSELMQVGRYELVEKLLDVPKSADPWLKMMAVLGATLGSVKHVAGGGQQPAMSNKHEAVSNVSTKSEKGIKQPPVVEAPAPMMVEDKKTVYLKEEVRGVAEKDKMEAGSKKLEVASESPKAQEPEQSTQPKAEKSAPIEINWDDITTAAKKMNAPCGALISHGSYEYDGETLTLYFKTNLLRCKMKEQKCWQTLKNALNSLYKVPPKVVVSDGMKPKSASVNKVADIMGGGELL